MVELKFGPAVPYSGPPVSPVGTTVKTKDEREAAEAAAAAVTSAPAAVTATAITPSAQLSTAAPTPQSPEPPKTVTVSPTGPNVTFSNKTKEDVEASTAYKTYAYSNQTPVQPPAPQTPAYTTPVGITQRPVIIPGTKDAREAAAAAAAGPDWVKLALQLGAAYLLFS